MVICNDHVFLRLVQESLHNAMTTAMATRTAKRQFLVCNHVTRRPCWGQYNRNFAGKINMKIEFSSQRREMLLFLTTNMAAVTSRANQQ